MCAVSEAPTASRRSPGGRHGVPSLPGCAEFSGRGFGGDGDFLHGREAGAIDGEIIEPSGEAEARDACADAARTGAHVFGRERELFVLAASFPSRLRRATES